MAKKTSIKVRLVPESKPDSPFFYYVKKPSGGEKAKIKLKIKKESLKKNIDPKITHRIWKNMIWSYIDFEKRNFKKK